MRTATLLLAFALTACANHGAPVPSGEWRPLNPGAWDVPVASVTVPDMPKITEAKP